MTAEAGGRMLDFRARQKDTELPRCELGLPREPGCSLPAQRKGEGMKLVARSGRTMDAPRF